MNEDTTILLDTPPWNIWRGNISVYKIFCIMFPKSLVEWLWHSSYLLHLLFVFIASVNGGERTRVSADTLVKMVDNYFVASESYRQIYRHSAFCGDPSSLRLLLLTWETLRQRFKSCKAVIQAESHPEKSCGDEGYAHFCFPGAEGDCLRCRGWRHDRHDAMKHASLVKQGLINHAFNSNIYVLLSRILFRPILRWQGYDIFSTICMTLKKPKGVSSNILCHVYRECKPTVMTNTYVGFDLNCHLKYLLDKAYCEIDSLTDWKHTYCV